MIVKPGPLLLCTVLLATGVSCGFKSDLFLPGQPQRPEQYDSKSLKDLGGEKLRQLQDQNESPSEAPVTSGNEASVSENAASVPQNVPIDGVVVELPSDEEKIQDKSKLPKKTVSDDPAQ